MPCLHLRLRGDVYKRQGQVCAFCLGLSSGGMSALLLPVLLLGLYGVGILLTAAIRALFHKCAKRLVQIGLIVLGVSTAAFPFCAGMGLPTSLLLLGLLAGLVGIVCPVSYTHLDVYKRQERSAPR